MTEADFEQTAFGRQKKRAEKHEHEAKEREDRQAYERWIAQRLQRIKATSEYQHRVAERRDHWTREQPTWSDDTAETTARQEVYHELLRIGPLTRDHWRKSQQK